MRKVILEFTLNGHKKTYYRRTNIFGEVVTTTNVVSAKRLKEEEAKAKVVYRKISVASGISLAVQGLVPIALFIWYTGVA